MQLHDSRPSNTTKEVPDDLVALRTRMYLDAETDTHTPIDCIVFHGGEPIYGIYNILSKGYMSSRPFCPEERTIHSTTYRMILYIVSQRRQR
jgi:hypothetical protein